MSMSQMVVLPSRLEGLPLVLMEAGLLAKPVVASRVGGIPELVQHMKNGLLVESEDVKGLADAIRALVDDDALKNELGQRLKETVEGGFTWEKACAQYLEIASS